MVLELDRKMRGMAWSAFLTSNPHSACEGEQAKEVKQ